MRCWTVVALATLLLVGCHRTAGTAEAASRAAAGAVSSDQLNDTPVKLARAWVSAVQSKDAARVQKLLHPRLLACRNDSNGAYFDNIVSNEMRDVPSGDYNITALMLQGAPPSTGLPQGLFSYPVSPTAQIKIEWTSSQYSSTTLIRNVAPEGGRWYLIYPCPNAAGMRYFNEEMARERVRRERAKKLAVAIKPDERAELVDLLNHGRKIDAVKKYQAATGADLTTAVEVINRLQAETQSDTK
jgi:outer membrane murein-binding lipoprotein Lpp